MVDCNTDDAEVAAYFPYCEEENRKKLPALLYSQPSLNNDGKSDTVDL
jgi:hypothetical protein